jgi:hypothetical protein
MALFKTILAILFGITIGFVGWYFIGWFISNQQNPLLWPWYGKVIYLFFAFVASDNLIDEFTKRI